MGCLAIQIALNFKVSEQYACKKDVYFNLVCSTHHNCLCGLVVTVLDYRSGGLGSIPGTTKKKAVGLERGALNLVSTTEELLDRKVAAPV
jgi:hypothetical protein